MKKYFLTTCIAISILFLQSPELNAEQSNATVFYVSPKGNDSWLGKISEPGKNDGPFATPERAKKAVRELKKKGTLPSGRIEIIIRGGVYTLGSTFRLSEEDSGLEGSPVVWKAYPGEDVLLIGGSVVKNFKPVTDKTVLARFEQSAKDKILQADLKSQGISDFGLITASGWMNAKLGMEVFFRGKPMTIARYPNEGWLKVSDVPQTGEKLYYEGIDWSKRDGIPAGRNYGRFVYDTDKPAEWKDLNDIWMLGYWSWDWADSYERIGKIDKSKKEIYFANPQLAFGVSKNQRYYFLNIMEELNSPGEWFIDRKEGILYFWPPEPLEKDDVMVSVLDSVMVLIDGASNISLEGIIFECSRGDAVEIKGGENNRVAGCAIRNIGGNGVIIEGGTGNGVLSCDIYDVGNGGIILNGGLRETLTAGNNYAENNHIHHYSRINRTYKAAVTINGVGNRMSHNLIHDAPHMGVSFNGNEQLLDYNEIHDIAQETGDVGALYIANDWTQQGNIIKHNYFHHIHGPGAAGARSVYLDNWSSGTTVYGNVFYKAGMATMIGGGRDNLVENNIYIECDPSVWIDARGTTWANFWFNGQVTILSDMMKKMKYSEPPYSVKYPQLLKYQTDEPAMPKGNVIVRNISYGGKWLGFFDPMNMDIMTMKDNLIADPIIMLKGPNSSEIDKGVAEYKSGDAEITAEFTKMGNIIIPGDPGFVDLNNGNFNLKKDSQAFKLGFRPIPVEKIGLYKDDFRNTLPKKQ